MLRLQSLFDSMTWANGKISMNSGHEVEWKIDNFRSFSWDGFFYISPRFVISGTKWRLKVYPNGQSSTDSAGWISFYLINCDKKCSLPVSARYIFGVKKVDGTVEHTSRKVSHVFEKHFVGYGYSKLLKKSKLLERKSEMLAGGTLTLICTLWTGNHFEPCGSMDTLSRNFADLFISKKGCDATIKVMDKKISVHKFILSARSSVFAAMFQVDMKEKKTGVVEIPDFDPQTFKEFLIFLYSGRIMNVSCNIFELYKIANKYDVQDLKSQCRLLIVTDLSVENVLEAANLGSQFKDEALECKTQRFFNQNYKEIIPTTEWDEFLRMNTAVANKLLKVLSKK